MADIVIMSTRETKESGGLPSIHRRGLTLQTKERRVMRMYITYADLIQLLIFIVALVDLCYQIFKGKKK